MKANSCVIAPTYLSDSTFHSFFKIRCEIFDASREALFNLPISIHFDLFMNV